MTRVLVVGAEAEQLRWTLEKEGFSVEVAKDAESATGTLQQKPFDLVLSGVVLPGASGYELCTMVKGSRGTRDIPVILLSSLNDPMTIIRALQSGADNFLAEPYDPEHLISRVHTALSNKSLRASRKPDSGLVTFHGTNLAIDSEKDQVLDLLMSTVEDLVRNYAELNESREQLAGAKDELERYAQDLEKRVAERTQDLQARQDETIKLHAQLVEVARLCSMGELAASLAHELNQPLTAAANFLGAAEKRIDSDADCFREDIRESIRHAVSRAKDEVLRAGEIVRRLRQFIARGDTDMRIESLPKLVSEAAMLGLPTADRETITVTLDIAPDVDGVFADKVQIQQVLVNLIRNAAEAMAGQTNPPPEIRIAARCAAEGEIELCVADNGPGLADDISSRLFSPFVSSKTTGLGVGLSICKRIIEAHGGKIWSTSAPGGGTMFHFTLASIQAGEGDDE